MFWPKDIDTSPSRYLHIILQTLLKIHMTKVLLAVTSLVNEQDLLVGRGHYGSQTSKAFKDPLARKSRHTPWPRRAVSLCKPSLVNWCTTTGDISRCCELLLGLEIFFPYHETSKNPRPREYTDSFSGKSTGSNSCRCLSSLLSV